MNPSSLGSNLVLEKCPFFFRPSSNLFQLCRCCPFGQLRADLMQLGSVAGLIFLSLSSYQEGDLSRCTWSHHPALKNSSNPGSLFPGKCRLYLNLLFVPWILGHKQTLGQTLNHGMCKATRQLKEQLSPWTLLGSSLIVSRWILLWRHEKSLNEESP